MNILKKRIGIIGGGQLGKMMILDAKRLGFYCITLDPTPDCPSHSISDEHIIAAFDDEKAIRQLAESVDVMTYEFEHIGVQILEKLHDEGEEIYPTPKSLAVIQNKFTQKTALLNAGIPVPDFVGVQSPGDIKKVSEDYGYPMMLKTCYGGYDGKGNALIRSEDQILSAFESLGAGKLPLMVERFVPFEKEISVLACRGIDGRTAIYPVAENIHKDSILDTTLVPASVSTESTSEAMKLAEQVMDVFHGVGMFCVEMFITHSGEVSINEVAPRPHNSGHYTIEGCLTSQFENHIRAITGLPLGDVSLRSPSVMRNLLGTVGYEGETEVVGLKATYVEPMVKVHIYGKSESKAYRKMGHLTAIGDTLEAAKLKADLAFEQISIIGARSVRK